MAAAERTDDSQGSKAVVRKRCLLWDWTNTRDRPNALEQLNFAGPIRSLSNWNAWIPPELRDRLPFRPMVRTPVQLPPADEWNWIRDRPSDSLVHFYNEPERQPGLRPAAAARDWKAHMVGDLRARRGMRLVGPAVASDEPGRTWLRAFMAELGGDAASQPDFLGAHYYGTVAAEAAAYLEGLHAEWPALPVVVSEVASISRDKAAVEAFTAELADWMDGTEWVYEYAFFGCMAHVADDFVSPAAQLMDGEGKFTPLMVRLMNEQPMRVAGQK